MSGGAAAGAAETSQPTPGQISGEEAEITFPKWLQGILDEVARKLNENDMTRLFFCTKNGTNFCNETRKNLTNFKFIVRDNISFHITYEVNETVKEKKADLSFTLKFEIGDDEEGNKKIVWISRLNDPTWSKLSIMIQKKNDSSKTILLVPKGKADMIPTEKNIWQWFQRHFQGGQREVISTNTKKTQKTYGLDIIVPVFTTQKRAILEVEEIKVAAKEDIPNWFEGTGSCTLKEEAVKGVDKKSVQKLYNKNFKFDYTHDFTEAEKQGGGQKFKSVPALCLPAFGAPLPNFMVFKKSTEAQVLKKANYDWTRSLAQVFQLVPETLLAGTEDEYTREWAQTCFALLNNQLDFSLSLDSNIPLGSPGNLPSFRLDSSPTPSSPGSPGNEPLQAAGKRKYMGPDSDFYAEEKQSYLKAAQKRKQLKQTQQNIEVSQSDSEDDQTFFPGTQDLETPSSPENEPPQPALIPLPSGVVSPGNVPTQLLRLGETPGLLPHTQDLGTPLQFENTDTPNAGPINSMFWDPGTVRRPNELDRAVNTEQFGDVLSPNETPAADVLKRLGEGPQARFVDRCLNFY